MSIKVKFHKNEQIDNDKLLFAVIVARYNNKWIFCKHKERNTYEIPGGRREKDENIDDTAKRELYEETGALRFDISSISIYSVIRDEQDPSYGKLYFADIYKIGDLPESEIEAVYFFDDLPNELAYPDIQPILYRKVKDFTKQYI